MKWDEKYPHANMIDDYENYTIYVGDEHAENKCIVCGSPTRWMSISYESWMCSEECEKAVGESVVFNDVGWVRDLYDTLLACSETLSCFGTRACEDADKLLSSLKQARNLVKNVTHKD